ncbi:hypothetical protein HMPREF1861_02145 [Corynebacterium kroppenstedtii]|nr:hypothetical protein HMPREF1861_02145 [Corynebacterium kroppenstedtii]
MGLSGHKQTINSFPGYQLQVRIPRCGNWPWSGEYRSGLACDGVAAIA